MKPPLTIERVESEAALAALESDWTMLEQRCHNALPFRTFVWNQCWWRHLHEDGVRVRDVLAVRVARTSDGQLVGVAPLMLTERPGLGPLRLRSLQFLGADPNVTEVRGPLCEAALETACVEVFTRDLAQSTDADLVHWIVPSREPAFPLFGHVIRRDDRVCHVLDLEPTWEAMHAALPRNLKEALRKCYNSLQRAGLAYRFEVVTAPADVPRALEDFFRLHAARAKLTGTIAHRDVFDHPRCRAFLVEVCTRFARVGDLRVFRLHVDGILAATRIGFAMGDGVYLYYSGFDPSFAKYSVMTTTLAEAIKYGIEQRCRWVNLSTGRDVSKLRWRPREETYRELVMVRSQASSSLKVRAAAVAERAVRTLGAAPILARRARFAATDAGNDGAHRHTCGGNA